MQTVSHKSRAGYKRTLSLSYPKLGKSFSSAFSANVALIGCFLLSHVCLVRSQQQSQSSTQPGMSAAAPESSTILITARAKSLAPTEFSKADINIKEDGKTVTVEELHRVAGAALHYCLLLDTSGSQREQFKLEQNEAGELLSKVVRAGRDNGMLVAFSDKAYFDAEGTNPLELVKAIAQEQPRGSTALYDAVVSSANRMSKAAPSPSLSLMFILSDGQDNSSRASQDEALSALLKAGIRVYVMGLRIADSHVSSRQIKKAAGTLKQLAESTGGKAYFPANQQDVGEAVTDIAADLTNIFSLTYTLPGNKPDGRLHKLEVNCNKKDVSIKAPDRYFAPIPQ